MAVWIRFIRLVFWRAAVTARKPAIITTLLSMNPENASAMVEVPVRTRRQHARIEGAPKENLSDIIMAIIRIRMAREMIIWAVIGDYSSVSLDGARCLYRFGLRLL